MLHVVYIYMYMHLCIYVCVYMYMYIYIHIHIYIRIYMYMYIYIYMLHAYASMRSCTRARMRSCPGAVLVVLRQQATQDRGRGRAAAHLLDARRCALRSWG